MQDIDFSQRQQGRNTVWDETIQQIFRPKLASISDEDKEGLEKKKPSVATLEKDEKPTDAQVDAFKRGIIDLATRLQLSPIGAVARAFGQEKEVAVKGFSFDGQNVKEQLEAVKKFKSAVDYKQLLDNASKIVFFGETHPLNELRDELRDNIKQFKKLGFTHLAMEALPSERQKLIDDYYAGKATRDQVLEALKKDWGWSPESYMKLIDAAKDEGIKIVCLDVKITKEQKEKWAKDKDYSADSRFREAHWAKIMDAQLKADPKARIMALVGMGHTGIDATKKDYLTTLTKEAGHKPLVINLCSPERSFKNYFDEAVETAKLQGERFMIPVYGKDSFRPCDYIIHVPGKADDFPFLKRKDGPQIEMPLQYRFQIPGRSR